MGVDDEVLKPDPQALLNELKMESGSKAKLKIFLGYAPGVGKTYSMLEQARSLKARGIDVVVGVVETHKRADTAALLEGLEVLPLKEINYKGVVLKEFDLESALKRAPKVILIDELAHSNAPGFTHLKRYQDVEDLITNGIDVYTTVNIQHFESVNDVVAGVTGVKVQETVPDSMLDEAGEVEIVDIPIEELHLRLKEGKAYIPEQAKKAVEQYFKRSNLLALREITLRRVATKLDTELVNYMKAKAIMGPWPVTDRLLVCVSPSPFSRQLIRKAYQLAESTKAEWYALYVESVSQLNLDDTTRAKLAETLEFAEELGAKVRTISGSDVAEEVLKFSESEKITKIMMGKPPKKFMADMFNLSPASKIINSKKEIDIYLIEPKFEDNEKEPGTGKAQVRQGFKVLDYFYSLLTLIPVLAVGFVLNKVFNIGGFSTIFSVSVVSSAYLFGMGPAIFVSVLSVLFYDFLFVKPYYSLTITNPEYAVELIIFLAVSFAMAELTRLFRRQKEALRIRLENIRTLEQMGRELLGVPSIESVMESTVENKNSEIIETIQLINVDILEQVAGIVSAYLSRVLKEPNMVIFKDRDNKLKVWAHSVESALMSQNDHAIANWVYEKGEPAGLGSRTLVASEYVFFPMTAKSGTTGVIAMKTDLSIMLPQDRYFITVIANFAAIAAEKCVKLMGKKNPD